MRVFNPLKSDHPLVTDGDTCAVCRLSFCEGQRTTLAPVREPIAGVETVEALPLHATCALRGAKTRVGVVYRIKDGDASPFPVETEDHKQYTLEEAGYA